MTDATLLTPAYELGVTFYRVFRMDKRGGIVGAEIIDARSDDEAIGKARALTNGHGLDLWERSRHLGTFPPRQAA